MKRDHWAVREGHRSTRALRGGKAYCFVSAVLTLFLGAGTPAQSLTEVRAPDPVVGQSRTLLSSGRWLLIGGTDDNGPRASLMLSDGSATTPLPFSLNQARSGHTATVLPNGTVLVLGGIGSDGQLVPSAEVVDVVNSTVRNVAIPGLQPRANHSATLLTDGTILVAGGMDEQGAPQSSAQLLDSRALTLDAGNPTMMYARAGQTATLQSDGNVLVAGGVAGVPGQSVATEQFNATTRLFESAYPVAPNTTGVTATVFLDFSLPSSDAVDVPVDGIIALRFSGPARISDLNAQTITLVGPFGPVIGKVVGAEGGRLAFFTPAIDLRPGATYTLFVKGIAAATGEQVPLASIRFATHRFTEEGTQPTPYVTLQGDAVQPSTPIHESRPGTRPSRPAPTLVAAPPVLKPQQALEKKPDPNADDGNEDWLPQEPNRHGDWRVLGLQGDPKLNTEALAAPDLSAFQGTAVAGRVLAFNGRPIAGVPVSVGAAATTTDSSGRFLLPGIAAGLQQVKIDGTDVNNGGRHYTEHFLSVAVHPKGTTALQNAVFLPRVDPASEVSISSPAEHEIVLTHPAIPGLEVRIPQGAVLRTYDGKIVTKVSITPIPVDRAPYPTPVPFSVYFTLQPGGAYVDGDPTKAIRIIYPNYQGLAPGARVNFWNYDPGTGGWRVYGYGTVSADGKTVVPDESVGFRQIMTFGYGIGGVGANSPPVTGPPPGGCSTAGDPVDCATGLFLHYSTDLLVRDVVPISISRMYRQNDNVSRAFGVGGNLSYAMWLAAVGTSGTQVDLVLADGGRVHFAGANDVFTNADSPTIFHGATIAQDTVAHQWALTLANGTVLRFTPHVPNQLVSITDRNGNVVSIALSGSNVTQVTSPSGRYIQFTYDPQNRITQANDNTGRTVSYTYDASGRLFQATDAAGYFEQYGYDAASNGMNSVTDKRGNLVTQNWFDANGRVYRQQLADGAIWQFAYILDTSGNVTQTTVTDPRGSVRQDTFNASGYLINRVLAQGQSEQQTYIVNRDLMNLVRSIVDPLSRTTAFSYDAYGNITSMTKLAGTANAVTYSFQYEPVYRQLVSVTDPLSHVWAVGRDANGNASSITDPLGHVTGIAYNGRGLPTRITDALGDTVQLTYRAGDLASIVDGLNQTTSTNTDGLGRLDAVVDPLGNRQEINYDVMDRVSGISDAQSGMTGLSYDQNGNLLTLTDPRGVVQTYTYDARNRPHTYKDPKNFSATYNFDGMGNLTSTIDRRNQTTTYTYDGLNRVRTVTYNDGSSVTITWDAGNRPRQFADTLNGTINRIYDDLDRLTEESGPQGTVDYAYDAAGRRQSVTIAGQATPITYQFDNANRLTQIQRGTATVSFTYDNADRPATVTLPNGVIRTYGFDAANELRALNYDLGATHIGDLAYTYDAAGRRISRSGALATMPMPPSITSTVYDPANRLTTWGSTTQTFDNNGNLATSGTVTNTWNARNQLTASSAGSASFSYDALGRRVSKTVSAVMSTTLYDGFNPLVMAGSTYLEGMGLDDVLASVNVGSGAVTSYATDAIGSVVGVLNSSGAVTGSYGYDPYGNTAGSGATSTLQFTGRENDGTYYYYRARYYDPATGRFLSEDPLNIGGGYNLYAYVGGDPVDYRDPTGRCPWCVAAAVVGAATNAAMNYRAYDNGQISGLQYFEDIVVGAGTGFISGIPGGYALSLVVGGVTASANEGIQELVNGRVDPCKITVAAGVGSLGGLLSPVGEYLGSQVSRPVIGSLLTSPAGYPVTGANIGFGLSLAVGALPIPDWAYPGQ